MYNTNFRNKYRLLFFIFNVFSSGFTLLANTVQNYNLFYSPQNISHFFQQKHTTNFTTFKLPEKSSGRAVTLDSVAKSLAFEHQREI